MIANHIHDALAQVRTLQELILEKRIFKGYSGKARIAAGTLALACAVILARCVCVSHKLSRRAWTGTQAHFAALAASYGQTIIG